MFSLRVSVQRIGLPVARATQPTSTSSTAIPLAPNPPPTSGATTRTFSGSRPSSTPRTILSWWGVCELIHSVSRPSSPHCAALERGSIGHAASRWLIDLALDDDLGGVEQVRVGALRRNVDAHVRPDAGVDHDLVAHRLLGVGHRLELLVVDVDELGGVDARLTAVGEHDRDDVANEPDRVGAQQRPEHLRVDRDERRQRVDDSARVGGDEHLRAGGLRGRLVDPVDLGVRHVRAHERQVQRARQRQVVDVAALASEEARVLAAANALSDDVGQGGRSFAHPGAGRA